MKKECCRRFVEAGQNPVSLVESGLVGRARLSLQTFPGGE
jgi:hypothetical protein